MADPRSLGWVPDEEADAFNALVGPLWRHGSGAASRFGFVAQAKHLSRLQRLHGAMVMWLADKAMATAARYAVGDPQQLATVQLDTHFLQVVNEGEFVHAQCEVVRSTRTLVFVHGRLLVGETPVAAAHGIWKYR